MTETSLSTLLARFHNLRGWLMPISDERGKSLANNGDLLMHRVLHDLCDELSITMLDHADSADFIAIPPNGALLDRFRAPDIIRQQLLKHRDQPVVIFPSSAQFLRRNPSEIFKNRSAPTLWILREPYSYEHLATQWGRDLQNEGVDLALDHDVVVTGAHHLERYFPAPNGPSRRSSRLLVPRLGTEANDIRNENGVSTSEATKAGAPRKTLASLSRLIPDPMLRPMRRVSTYRRIQTSSKEIIQRLPQEVQGRFEAMDLFGTTDISDTSLVSFDEYRARIAAAELVVSNRLHVAMPAALLGKQTYLLDSGYHKLRGIYEHSLSHLDNLTLVARQ